MNLNTDSDSSDCSEKSFEDMLNVIMMFDTDLKSIVPKIVNQKRVAIPKSNFWIVVYP